MAVDRGGLSYPITTPGATQSIQNVKELKLELAALRQEMEAITKKTGRKTFSLSRERANIQKEKTELERTRSAAARANSAEAKAAAERLKAFQDGAKLSKEQVAARRQQLGLERDIIKNQREEVKLLKDKVTLRKAELSLQRQIEQSKNRERTSIKKEASLAGRQARIADRTDLQQIDRDQKARRLAATRAEKQAVALRKEALRFAKLTNEEAKQNLQLEQSSNTAKQQGLATKKATVAATTRGLQAQTKQVGLIRRFVGGLKDAEGSANRLSFTFRRLIGIFAAFALVRNIVEGFKALVSEAVGFNRRIESAQLGIASLFLAVGQVRDITGETVDAAQGLALAQEEARRQTQLLRADALRTKATFDELVDTFQVAIGPGLAAGLDIGQVRRFTVQISQAASALGVAQNQLSEEIRSILSGTIQQRTTRIAAALGITNEDIRNARELGVLVEFLQTSFSAFDTAGQKSLTTFDGILARIRDSFSLVLGTAGLEFFDDLKEELTGVFEALTVVNPITNITEAAPQAVSLLREFFSVLSAIVSKASELAHNIDPNRAIMFARSLSAGLQAGVDILASFISGFAQSIGFAVRLASVVLRIFNNASDFASLDIAGTLGVVAGIMGTVLGLALALKAAMVAIGATTILLRGTWVAVNALAAATLAKTTIIAAVTAKWSLALTAVQVLALNIAATFTKIKGLLLTNLAITGGWSASILGALAPLLLVVGALTAAAILVRKILKDATGVSLNIQSLFNFITTSLGGFIANAVDNIFSKVKLGIANAKSLFAKAASFIADKFFATVDKILTAAAQAAEFFKADELARQLKQARASVRDFSRIYTDELSKQEKAIQAVIDQEKARREQFKNDLNATLDQELNRIIEEDPNDGRFLGPIVDKVKELTAELVGGTTPAFDDLQDSAGSFSDLLESLPGIIRAARQPLEANSALMKQLKKEALDAASALSVAQATSGLSGAGGDLIKASVEAQIQLQERSKDLVAEQSRLEQELLGVEARRVRLRADALRLNKEDRAAVEEGVAIAKEAVQAQTDLGRLEREQAKANRDLLLAKANGSQKEIQAAEAAAVAKAEEVLQQGVLIEQIKLKADAIQDGVENEEEFLELVTESLKLQGQEVTLSDNLKDNAQDRANLEAIINDTLAKRQALISQNALAGAQTGAAGAVAGAGFSREQIRIDGIQDQGDKAQAQRTLNIRKQEFELAQQNREALRQINALSEQREKITQRVAELVSMGASKSEQQKSELESQVTSLQTITQLEEARGIEADANLQRGKELLDQLDETNAKLTAVEEGNLSAVFVKGLEDFVAAVPAAGVRMAQILTQSLQTFASQAATTVVDLFDPTKDVNIRERVARFFQGIARQILTSLFQQLIASLIQGVGIATTAASALTSSAHELVFASTSLGTAAAQWSIVAAEIHAAAIALAIARGVSGAPGLRTGGNVGEAVGLRQGGNVGGAHAKAKGFATGGRIKGRSQRSKRPSGLSPRDTVPIWADPREWVIRAEAVKRYGGQVMQAFNQGLFDPAALMGMLGGQTVPSISVSEGPGFVDGGPISTAQAPSPRSSANESPDQAAPQMIEAQVAPTEQNMKRQLAGGRRAMIEFISDNSSQINRALGR